MVVLHRVTKGLAVSALFLLVVVFVPFIGSTGKDTIPASPAPPDTAPPQTDFTDYIWPTEADPVITSTFAEYRRAHFHGGIDIGTGDDTGFRVFASRDGYVSRISVSPTGYGKMLFIRHPDGFFTTYAHLRNFAAAIDERVALEQEKKGAYPVDIRCGPEEFPVIKGEVVAFTGETGVGTPHLHFEIRDPNNNFVNPLQCATFPNRDTILPTVRRIAVTPFGETGMVDGSWKSSTYNLTEKGAGTYEVRSTIHISGAAGMAIDVRDRAEGTYYRQGIRSHQLFVDDVLVYTVELDRAPSENSHQSGLYYDWDLSDAGLGRFQRLYSLLPNDLWFYSPRKDSAGIIAIPEFSEGPHIFRIISKDRGGNSTTVSGKFVLHTPPMITISEENDLFRIFFEPPARVKYAHVSTHDSRNTRWSRFTKPLAEFGNPIEVNSRGIDMLKVVAEDPWGVKSLPQVYHSGAAHGKAPRVSVSHELGGNFVRLHVHVSGASAGTPTLKLFEGSREHDIPLSPVDLDHFMATFFPSDTVGGLRRAIAQVGIGPGVVTGFDEFMIYPLKAGASGTYSIDDGAFILSFDPSSVLNTVFAEVIRTSYDGQPSYRLEPANTVLDRGIIVGMRSSNNQEKAGLFAHTRRGWTLLASGTETSNGFITGRLTQTLGEVSIVADNTPPSISRVSIKQTRQAYPVISFRFDDGFAGIEYDELKMYIDERIVVPEVDGEHERAVYQTRQPLGKGSHLLTIRATDKLGNLQEFKKRFTVR